LVGSVLNHVAQHQGFVIAEVSLVEVRLDGARNFLETVLAVCPLNLLEMASRFTGHARTDHTSLCALPVIQRIGRKALKYPRWRTIYSCCIKRFLRGNQDGRATEFVSNRKAIPLEAGIRREIMSDTIQLSPGDEAPTFVALDQNGDTHDLKHYLDEGKTVIVYFYPKDSTPGCTTQACDFRDNMARLNGEDHIVLGVSKDSGKSHQRFVDKQELNFPLLVDEDLALHQAFGTWRLKKNYGREYMGCARSTFVISPDGRLAWCRYNVKAKGHVGMLMRELGLGE
jgi:peroxiredoxin Q/BCP